MEQMKKQGQTQPQEQSNTTQHNERLPFSEQLRQAFLTEPFDVAEEWHRAAASFPENRKRQRRIVMLAVVIGVIIGAVAMHFLASPERWIRI